MPQSDINALFDDEYVTAQELSKVFRISKASIAGLSKRGDFPKPLNFGGRIKRWNLRDVKAWIDNQKGENNQ